MAGQKKVLLAEDDKFISIAYKDGLERAGFEVLTSYDGGDVFKKAKKEQPDLILLDIIMPKKNGFEVLTDLKSDAVLKKIPVVILSNLGQYSDIQKGKTLGAEDYLIKANHTMKEVIAKVKEHTVS